MERNAASATTPYGLRRSQIGPLVKKKESFWFCRIQALFTTRRTISQNLRGLGKFSEVVHFNCSSLDRNAVNHSDGGGWGVVGGGTFPSLRRSR